MLKARKLLKLEACNLMTKTVPDLHMLGLVISTNVRLETRLLLPFPLLVMPHYWCSVAQRHGENVKKNQKKLLFRMWGH